MFLFLVSITVSRALVISLSPWSRMPSTLLSTSLTPTDTPPMATIICWLTSVKRLLKDPGPMAGFSGDSPSALSCIVTGEKKKKPKCCDHTPSWIYFLHSRLQSGLASDGFFPLSFGSLSLFFASKTYLVYSVIFYHKILLFWGSLVQVSGLICFLIRNQGYQGQLTLNKGVSF